MAQIATTQQFPFVWEGTDKKGKRIKGKMLAVSEAAVKADLRRQGVLAKRVRKEVQLFKSGKKITAEDIALFARQLATMLQAGIPMVQCFDIIGNGHDKPAMQKLVLAIKADVEAGTSLHEALAKHTDLRAAVRRRTAGVNVFQTWRGEQRPDCAVFRIADQERTSEDN